MTKTKLSKVLKKIVIILLITAFSIGIIACSGDAITGSGRSYSSVDDNPPSLPDNPSSPDDNNPNLPGGDTNTTGGNTNTIGGNTNSNPSDFIDNDPNNYYDLRVPFVVKTGFTNVSYKDTNKLKQLWLDQINRTGMNDGKVFAIRNRANNRGINNFQNSHTWGKYSVQDYYYFNENGDIVWKGDNTIIKKFIGATIVRYRDLNIERGNKRKVSYDNVKAIINIGWAERKLNGKPLHTVGAIYANTLTTEEARKKYASDDNNFKYGVFDFITYRHWVETFHSTVTYANNRFERQYINPGFLEILVMYDYDNMGISGAAAVHSYYPYYGIYNYYKEYSGHPGVYFTPQNMPYMTNHNIYLAQRPEYTMNQLNHTAAFTDKIRDWYFLFIPGKPDVTGKSTSIKPIPNW